jgi:FMN-dependent NADH-azoreductase
MKLLHIDSSVLGQHSVSRQLTRDVVAEWEARQPDLELTYRDLAGRPPAPLSAETVAARQRPIESLTPAQRAERALDEELLSEFQAADVVVIGAPMYNFSIPAQLKAWIDRILVAGRTFRYGPNGPEGLVTDGKRVIVVSTRGGIYSSTPASGLDHQEAYLRTVFGFIGVTDVTIVRAEGVNLGAEVRTQAVAAAREELRVLGQAA